MTTLNCNLRSLFIFCGEASELIPTTNDDKVEMEERRHES